MIDLYEHMALHSMQPVDTSLVLALNSALASYMGRFLMIGLLKAVDGQLRMPCR